MNILAYIPGLGLSALCGWMALRLLEGRHVVLLRAERWMLGCMWGLTYGMFALFVFNVTLGMPFAAWTFLLVYGVTGLALFALLRWRRLPLRPGPVAVHPSPPLSARARAIWSILIGWVALRAMIAGTTFLLLTPTFLDDSLDNWNLRGKVFYETQTLTLVLPKEDPATSPMGVSSYPPSLPLMKAWLASLAGEWSEPVINGIQALWYAAALVLLYAALRRSLSMSWALLGVYILGGLPLFLMHGTNPYADAFMAAHIFAAVSMLFAASRAPHAEARDAFLRLAAPALAILPFVKNEGLLVYLPPLLLLLVSMLWLQTRRRERTAISAVRALVLQAAMLLLCAGPWLIFKWANGLTFGNAKPFTTLGIGWQENVLFSIVVNTFFEGNWLLLFALFFVLLVWKWRSAFSSYALPTLFFLIVYLGQAGLYLFTRLSVEALKQTGYARGLVHLVPVAVLVTVLLLHEVAPPFLRALRREE